jgi:pilus assembly protein Flp/PilA
MRIVLHFLRALGVDRRAVTSVEYGMIAAVIIVAIIGSVLSVSGHLSGTFNTVSSEF